MVEAITRETVYLVPSAAQLVISQRIMEQPQMMKRILNSEPLTNGIAMFKGFPLADGREVFLLVEYMVEMIAPHLAAAEIIKITFSDEEMPDEFLDIINKYRASYVPGTMEWTDINPKKAEE